MATNNYEGDPVKPQPLPDAQLELKYGIRTPAQLSAYNTSRPPLDYLIQDLIPDQGITVSIGASHVGKSPFWEQACIAVAGGLDAFLGRACHAKGGSRVLYIDCENRTSSIEKRLRTMSQHLGLRDTPPSFMVWSLNAIAECEHTARGFLTNWDLWLRGILHDSRPSLVIIDPISAICPKFGANREETYPIFVTLRTMMNEYKCSFVLVHHLRKPSQERERPNLSEAKDEQEVANWLDQAIGSGAINNGPDVRVGMDFCDSEIVKGVDVVIYGYEREESMFSPLYLKRLYSTDGEGDGKPVAYGISSTLDQLSKEDRDVWDRLPEGVTFPWKTISSAHPGKGRPVTDFFQRCETVGVLRKVKYGQYIKIVPEAEATSPKPPTHSHPSFKPKGWLEMFIWERETTSKLNTGRKRRRMAGTRVLSKLSKPSEAAPSYPVGDKTRKSGKVTLSK
jgi:hypothetical protein